MIIKHILNSYLIAEGVLAGEPLRVPDNSHLCSSGYGAFMPNGKRPHTRHFLRAVEFNKCKVNAYFLVKTEFYHSSRFIYMGTGV